MCSRYPAIPGVHDTSIKIPKLILFKKRMLCLPTNRRTRPPPFFRYSTFKKLTYKKSQKKTWHHLLSTLSEHRGIDERKFSFFCLLSHHIGNVRWDITSNKKKLTVDREILSALCLFTSFYHEGEDLWIFYVVRLSEKGLGLSENRKVCIYCFY